MKKYVVTAAGVAVVSVLLLSCTVRQKSEFSRTVTVTGSGAVSVLPDSAAIDLSVVTRNISVTEATTENAQLMTQVQEALLEACIQKTSLSTHNYRIYQESSYVNGKNIPGEYRVSNMLSVVVSDVTSVGSIIDTAITAGANELSSLDFTVSDTSDAVREARVLAVQQAQEAARLLAGTGGAKLGKLISITEENYNQPLSVSNQKLMAVDTAAATPVIAGKSNITVTVRAVFELQ